MRQRDFCTITAMASLDRVLALFRSLALAAGIRMNRDLRSLLARMDPSLD